MSVAVQPNLGGGVARSPWVTFTVCSLALFLTTLDLSIVNVAFPDILAEFDISRADASWIITTYNIFYGSLLVVSGKVADQLGRRRIFLTGLAVFAGRLTDRSGGARARLS